jgi:PAS domain S-box-containing protein
MDRLLSGRRILVVEDEMMVLLAIEDMLTDLGCEAVAAAATVDQALALIDAQGFDAAMLDVNLNGRKSYPVADVLTRRGVPFAFATGYGDHGRDGHYSDRPVLRKPFRQSELGEMFTGLLTRTMPAVAVNSFKENITDTPERDSAERHMEAVRQQGGLFVEAVRVTRMPMLVTDATLPGNPIIFANNAFVELSGYTAGELVGQDPHFMNGEGTDPEAIKRYQAAIREGRDETLEILQYRKDGAPFRAMLFASPLDDGQGTVRNHFLSYLDITRRYDAEEELRALTSNLEARVAARTEELEAANSALTKLVAERDMLLVEVNHRAKNSLSIASALLGIQGRRQSDHVVKALFEEAQDRLHAMGQVHDLLSKSESLQWVDLATYVPLLCETLRSITENDARIRLEAKVDEETLVHADTAVPLGLVLTELITNAVKYAFPAPRSGTILAEARRRQPGWIDVVVRDDGIGMAHLREGSLGYGLVRSLVKQIGGEIDIGGDSGLTVTISFPDESQSAAENDAKSKDAPAHSLTR